MSTTFALFNPYRVLSRGRLKPRGYSNRLNIRSKIIQRSIKSVWTYTVEQHRRVYISNLKFVCKIKPESLSLFQKTPVS